MFKKIKKFVFSLMILASCSETPYLATCNAEQPIISLQENHIDIQIENQESYDWNHMDHHSVDNQNYIYGLDGFRSEIHVVDLDKKEFVKTISLEDEGPNEIIDPLSIEVLSEDSIYLMSIGEWSTLYLIDSEGTKLNEWHINYPLPDKIEFENVISTVLWGAGKGDIPFFVNDNILVALCDFGTFESDIYDSNYKRPILAKVNLESRRFESLEYYRPETYRKASRIPHDDIANITKKDDGFLISFITNGQILNTVAEEYKCLSSIHSTGRVTTFKRGERHNESDLPKIFAMDDLYAGIHFDQKLNIGYRIFKKGYDQSVQNIQREESEWSIIVFDKMLNPIGETDLFPGGKYNFSLITVIEGIGILISKENFLDSTNDEETLSLTLFQPSANIFGQ